MQGFKEYINEGWFSGKNNSNPYTNDPNWSGMWDQIVNYYGGDETKATQAIQSAITTHGADVAPLKMFQMLNATAGGNRNIEDQGSRSNYNFDQYAGGNRWKS